MAIRSRRVAALRPRRAHKVVHETSLRNVQKFYPEVTTVRDADEDIQIEVTNRDSNSATVRNHKNCALAVACKRKTHADGVIMAVKTAYVVKGTEAVRYSLPERASREIVSFDRQGGFEAGEYTLKVPSLSQRLGLKKQSVTSHTGEGAKPKGYHRLTARIRTQLGYKEAM